MLCDTLEISLMMENMAGHQPVLKDEVVEVMRISRVPFSQPFRILDCTFGGGGHSLALLEDHPEVQVLALDRDPEAAARADFLMRRFPGRFRFEDMNFGEMEGLEDDQFHGVLMDLGLSSFQLDDAVRGFSFREEADLDMRMDPRIGLSAADFLETASEADLVQAVRNYGEETRWKRVVQAILQARGTDNLRKTTTLATLIVDALGPAPRQGRAQRIHPATRTFQGIRIAVNGELEALERALPVAFSKLTPGGILAVISFHSLEDRIVKRFMRRMAGRPEHGRDNRPQDERIVSGELITRKPIRPSAAEVSRNPRSRSSLLRVLKKLEDRPNA